jgi:hypothetical protein
MAGWDPRRAHINDDPPGTPSANVFIPFAGWARGRCAFEDEVIPFHWTI